MSTTKHQVLSLGLAVILLLGLLPIDYKTVDGVATGKLCAAQTGTGVCTSGGAQLVLDASGFYAVGLYSTQSTAATFVCDVYSNDTGYDADAADRQDMTATSLTETTQHTTLSGAMKYLWVECSSLPSGNVTVTFTALPLDVGY